MKRKPNILKCFQIFLNWGRVILGLLYVVVVQSLSHVQLFTTPWTAARQAPLSFCLLEFAQVQVHLILYKYFYTYI